MQGNRTSPLASLRAKRAEWKRQGFTESVAAIDEVLAEVNGSSDPGSEESIDPLSAARAAIRAGVLDVATITAPERKWILTGWIPRGAVTLFAGDGGLGKSTLCLQLAGVLAHTVSGPLIGTIQPPPDPPPIVPTTGAAQTKSLIVTWEDDRRTLMDRRITMTGGAFPAGVNVLPVVDLNGTGGPVFAEGQPLSFGTAILEQAEDLGVGLLVLDPIAAAFAGNENDRAEVRAFLTWLSGWAAKTGAAVLLVGHPPKGESRSAGYSGSTDWANGVRSVMTLGKCVVGKEWSAGRNPKQRPLHGLGLRLIKANLGPPQPTVPLAWHDRRIRAVSSEDAADCWAALRPE